MSEAANPEGADARSPEAEVRWFPLQTERRGYDKPMFTRIPWSVAEKAYALYSARYGRDQSLERLAERGGFGHYEMDTFYPDWREEVDENARLRRELAAASEAERAAESRGAKARDAEWRESIERALGVEADTENHTPGWAEGLVRRIREIGNARSPSGSPSVPAAQPKDQANQGAPIRDPSAPRVTLSDFTDKDRAADYEWLRRHAGEYAGMWVALDRGHLFASSDLLQDVRATMEADWPGVTPLLHRCVSDQPRAAPTPALPREAPEPGGTLTGTPERVLFMQAKSWPGEGGDVYSESRCAFCARPVAADATRLRLARTNDGEWWVIPERPVAPDEQQFGHFILPIGPDCLGRHPEFRIGLVGPQETP